MFRDCKILNLILYITSPSNEQHKYDANQIGILLVLVVTFGRKGRQKEREGKRREEKGREGKKKRNKITFNVNQNI